MLSHQYLNVVRTGSFPSMNDKTVSTKQCICTYQESWWRGGPEETPPPSV